LDNCPPAWNSDQLDSDGDGKGVECDLGDQYQLYSTSQLSWLKNLATRMDRFIKKIEIPLGPCRQDCPDSLPEDFMNEISITLNRDSLVDVVASASLRGLT
jgi:hypothetical protein